MASVKPTESAILNPGDPIRPEKPAPSKLLAGSGSGGRVHRAGMVLQQFRAINQGLLEVSAKTVSINREETDKEII